MLKTILALATIVALGAAVPAFAQETIGQNGHVVDGHGGGGQKENRTVPDGPGYGTISRAPDGTCYLHTRNDVFVVRCPATR